MVRDMINIGCPRKGFYFPIGLLTAILVLVVGICVAPFAAIADPPGGQTELIAIERICERLLCNQLQSKRWRELVPYLRDPNALDKVQVICGGGCGGTLQLRDGIELRFGYPYVPAKSNGEQDEIGRAHV